MKDNFSASLSHLLVSEGGRVDDPKDPGGRTDHGVTQHLYDIWRTANKQPLRNVYLIDQNEIEAVYRNWFWNAVAGDLLPAGVDYATFDFAVNSGPHEAVVCLQTALGVSMSGLVDQKTLDALKTADPLHIINSVCAERLAFMRGLKNWEHDKNGWQARVATVEQVARGMA